MSGFGFTGDAAPTVTCMRGVPLRTFGDSLLVQAPGENSVTVGQQVAATLGMTLTEGAAGGVVGGTAQALDVVQQMVKGTTLARVDVAAVPSVALPATPRGVVLISAGGNDVAEYGAAPAMLTKVRNALRAAVALAQSVIRIGVADGTFTFGPDWWAGPNPYAFGPEGIKATATAGSWVDVAILADRPITLYVAGVFGAGGVTVEAEEDGDVIAAWDTSNAAPNDAASTNLGYVPYFPLTVPASGVPGPRTVRFRTTSAAELDLLGASIGSPTPAEVLLLLPPGPADPWASYVPPKIGVPYYSNGTDAGLAAVVQVVREVAAEQPFVQAVDLAGLDKATMIAQPYGAHFNDRGVAFVANRILPRLLALGWRDGVQIITNLA